MSKAQRRVPGSNFGSKHKFRMSYLTLQVSKMRYQGHLKNPIRSFHLPVPKNPGKLLGPKFFALMSSCHDHVPLSFLTHLGSTFETLDAIHELMRFLRGWDIHGREQTSGRSGRVGRVKCWKTLLTSGKPRVQQVERAISHLRM